MLSMLQIRFPPVSVKTCKLLSASQLALLASHSFHGMHPSICSKGSCSAFRDVFILVAHWEYTLTLQAGNSIQFMDYEDGPLHLHILPVEVQTTMLSLFCLKALKRTSPRTRSMKRSCDRAS